MPKMKEEANDFVKESVFTGKLKCGLPIYVMPKKGFAKKYAIFATDYGSIDRQYQLKGDREVTEVPDGVAHFLEHKMFEKEDGDVFMKFSESGASANANTSFTQTKYLFSATRDLRKNLDLLLDFVQVPYFTDATVEKEKGIIAQEIKMYEDAPPWRLFFNLLGALYHQHPVKIDIAGTVDSIDDISKETLFQCWHTFYHPKNMGLFIASDDDPEEIYRYAKMNLERREYAPMDKINRILPEEPASIAKPEVRQKMAVAMPKLLVGFKETEQSGVGAEQLKRNLAMAILLDILFGSSSDFYTQQYQSGLIDGGTFQYEYTGERSFGFTAVGGDTPRPEELYRAILNTIRECHKKNWIEKHFERARNNMLGKLIRSFSYPETCAYLMCESHFLKVSPFEGVSILRKMRHGFLEDRLAEHLDTANHCISIIEPLDTKKQ